jgi:carboxylate-amine ligase
VKLKKLLYELLDFVDDVLDPLNSRFAIKYIENIIHNGTGADKQLKVFNETKDLNKVVDLISGSFTKGI